MAGVVSLYSLRHCTLEMGLYRSFCIDPLANLVNLDAFLVTSATRLLVGVIPVSLSGVFSLFGNMTGRAGLTFNRSILSLAYINSDPEGTTSGWTAHVTGAVLACFRFHKVELLMI